MITIDQLLESVDLDFEPRFVTKDEDGEITICSHRPKPEGWCAEWVKYEGNCKIFGYLKLSEFEGKDWTECIYEVPRKVVISKMETTEPIKKLNLLNDSALLWGKKINELVDAVNELKGAKNV